MAFGGDHRILSRPLRVHWAGWETTTARLQKAGWRLSARQDINGERLQLAFEYGSGHKLRAITNEVPFRYFNALEDYGGHLRMLNEIVLNVQHAIGDPVLVHHAGQMDLAFAPIDAEPRYTEARITRLEDLAHFAGPLIRTNEIIIPEESVPELLDRILKMQQPARIDRIKDELRGEHRPEQKFHAQIISLKDAA
jgi:hypothetical protein